MRASRLLALALPLLLLGAKGTKKAEPDAAPPAPEAGELTRQALETMKMTTAMTLVDAGAEPRKAVRFTPTPGLVTTSEMTQSMSMSMQLNGQTMPMPPAGTVTTSRTSIGERDAAGTVRVRTEILGVKGTGAGAGATQSLTGMATDILVSADGLLAGVELSGGGDDAAVAMAQQFAEQTLRGLQSFPTEPIGVGAKWTTSIDTAVAGISFVADATSTVKAITDDALDLDVTVTMKPGSTAFNFPGMPPGASMEMSRFEGSATGTQHVDLDRMVTSFSQDTSFDMELRVSMPEGQGPPGGIAMTMHMDMTMTGAPVATP